MSFASDMKQVAIDLLTEFGQYISVQGFEGSYVPATGSVLPDSPQPDPYEGFGYPSNYRQSDIDGSIVRQDDTLLIFESDTIPKVNDVFTVGSKVMTALDIQIITVAGSNVVYKIQLRQ